jgi:UDP-N-acetylglucosamine diphosphorylase / glucose-1-phosphate thymidylyltransferase / UDP-N-acetylgalactosamine diphosphorylase / glucosamine-1-phosphate N-acetyltransferase / galactosamine-1-phosphate N-acetyltransferase
MKCVMLAAGEGKRMHPLTFTQPKVMIPIANKPVIEWNLIHAKQAGITDFLLIVGYKDENVRSYFKDGSHWDVHIEYVNQGEPKGTGHAVGMVESFVDDFLVLCGDTIFSTIDIKNCAEQKQSIGLYKVTHPEEYGIVEIQNNQIKQIHEKMKQPFTNLINAGLYHFDSSIFTSLHQLKRSPRGEYELTDAINLITKEKPFSALNLTEWKDVGYPWDLLQANTDMLEKYDYKQEGNVESGACIHGNVAIGKDTIIKTGSYLEGPVVIGENCKIGPNCYIRPYTTIGNNCHVGNACEIKNSIIMDHSNVPHHNYVGDSVIGRHCNLGSGTKIANLRLDKKNIIVNLNGNKFNTRMRKLGAIMGDNVQTGINSMINVGSLIGNNVIIGPGAMVNGEIQPCAQLF